MPQLPPRYQDRAALVGGYERRAPVRCASLRGRRPRASGSRGGTGAAQDRPRSRGSALAQEQSGDAALLLRPTQRARGRREPRAVGAGREDPPPQVESRAKGRAVAQVSGDRTETGGPKDDQGNHSGPDEPRAQEPHHWRWMPQFVVALLDAELEEVRVEALKEDTFYAVAKLRLGDKSARSTAGPATRSSSRCSPTTQST